MPKRRNAATVRAERESARRFRGERDEALERESATSETAQFWGTVNKPPFIRRYRDVMRRRSPPETNPPQSPT
jgi:hypothetical protein